MPSFVSKTYRWQGFPCTYRLSGKEGHTPIVFVHPVGVGLSGRFWDRCVGHWQSQGEGYSFYIPDLLGCGQSALPHIAYYPEDWAAQLHGFIASEIRQAVILVVQGALFPVAMELVHLDPQVVRAMILSGPPAASLVSENTDPRWQKVRWNLFDSPLGWGFYLYARQESFLRQFSINQLFAKPEDVDDEWLKMLAAGCADLESRHAVYSFLSGFWRRDYREKMQQTGQPVLVVMGDQASSISREGGAGSPAKRLKFYTKTFPNAEGVVIAGRNVLPYESAPAFVEACQGFLRAQGL
ncbi:alpha/beta hydrolase [Thermosynechococcus sp. B3]|uniref:alpha/beta fold hydrolase n=1 Tax=unclassified Thermosynechococcus TaxID=2622553 RepID=UPI0025765034|nr:MULTISPECIES: alpha/beta hydrolase [unclassified Thermosynechococcus]WJI27421.1 alpha/beta hydrolase [Thermosynechococcus sp. B1]WJI29953.1 alpha/beta hydrolase [Thermosynechococcus sp. B3]